MNTTPQPKDIDVVILAGGLGTRIKSVIKDVPKVMAPINGKPFIDLLIENLSQQGFTKIVLCVGYMKDKIINHYRDWKHVDIVISSEETPLGTAGAIKNAERFIHSDNFIVLNGDSFCNFQYIDLIKFHLSKKSALSVVVSKIEETKDYGQIGLNKQKQIVSFCEKTITQEVEYTNSGIYCYNKIILSHIPKNKKYSNEYELFPAMIKSYKCYGFISNSKFWDIGTPERYDKFKIVR